MPSRQTPADDHIPVSAVTVADRIKLQIRRGMLAPGQRLVEADIMQDTGASRGKVREALQRLSTEGLVVIEEFRGASVKRLTRAEVQDIYHLREVLEGLAARRLTERAPRAALRRLEQLQAEMDACEQSGDGERFAELNDRWHQLIIEGAGNGLAAGFLDRLRTPIFRFQFGMFYSREVMTISNADHRDITAAILGGAPDLAEMAMRRHIRDGHADLSRRAEELFAP